MKKTRYGFGIEVSIDFESALELTKGALKEQGFGILTEIDVKKTLNEKLDVDFKRYKILGACNPPLAYKALGIEQEIGLILPCNVIVYETGEGNTKVSVIDPYEAMSFVGNPNLDHIAGEAAKKLRLALTKLSAEAVTEKVG